MGSPQDAALRHRLSSIRALIQSFQVDLTSAPPLKKPDIELLIRFFQEAELIAKKEIDLHELTSGGIDARKKAIGHPERYITNAPAPPLVLGDRTPPRPRKTRDEMIATKAAELKSELQKAEARSSELKETIDDWYLRAFPEWESVIAKAIAQWANGQRLAIEQYGALKSHYEQLLASQDHAAMPKDRKGGEIQESAISGTARIVHTVPQDSVDRQFPWSEIHSLAKEKTAQLDAAIRAEIGKPKITVPGYGADRTQFFLLLEEKANLWAERAREVYENCLQEIGRADSFSARSSVYQHSLSYFLNDNLRHFLYLECGCFVERPYSVRRPGQPRTFRTLKIPHDVGQMLSQIIDRVKSRIESKFIPKAESWTEAMQRTLREMQPQLQKQTTGNPLLDNPSTRAALTAQTLPLQPQQTNDGSKGQPKFKLSEDSRKVWIHGQLYLLTPGQGKMLRELWNAHEAKTGPLTRAALGKAIGSPSSEPRDTWKGHALWQTLILSPKPGFYELDQSFLEG